MTGTPASCAVGFEPVTDAETRCLRAETAASGLVELLSARGHRVLVEAAAPHGGAPTTSVVLASHPDDASLYRTAPVAASQERQWRDAEGDYEPRDTTALRRPLLDQSLTFLDTSTSTTRPLRDYLTGEAWDCVGNSPTTQPLAEGTRAAALAGWWADRMSQGYTSGPDGSAHLLLVLTLPVPVLDTLTYTADGTPILRNRARPALRP